MQPLIYVRESDKLSTVIEVMNEKGISQVPVRDPGGRVKGIVNESSLLKAIYEGRVKSSDSAESLTLPLVEFVEANESVEHVMKTLVGGKVALVLSPDKHGEYIGIVTKIDLLNFISARQ